MNSSGGAKQRPRSWWHRVLRGQLQAPSPLRRARLGAPPRRLWLNFVILVYLGMLPIHLHYLLQLNLRCMVELLCCFYFGLLLNTYQVKVHVD